MLDLADIFKAIVTVVLAVGGWLWKGVVSDLKALEKQQVSLEKKMIADYVKKEDYQRSNDRVYNAIAEMQKSIKEDLAAISAKLDTKQDK